jgi:hypothetical protein
MPDSFGIGHTALDGLRLGLEASVLRMPPTFTHDDSTRAAALMVAAGARCIITVGGDGTNRAVARAGVDVPLLPISTGTNNVFPTMVEGTIAGLAAGLVAHGLADEAVRTVPCLHVTRPDAPVDLALVDAAVCEERFVASRAVWDVATLAELVLTRAEPGNIGLSSIAAHLPGPNHRAGGGLYLRLGSGGQRVLAPIGPGLIRPVGLVECRPLASGDEVVVNPPRRCVLALDGEREVALRPGEPVRLRLDAAGPRVVDARRAIELGARDGVFLRS